VGLGLDDARAGNEEKLALANMDRTDFKGVAHAADFTLIGWPEGSLVLIEGISARNFTE
jgi:hypothetical protein